MPNHMFVAAILLKAANSEIKTIEAQYVETFNDFKTEEKNGFFSFLRTQSEDAVLERFKDTWEYEELMYNLNLMKEARNRTEMLIGETELENPELQKVVEY